jgi:hypothetical protein
VRIAPSGRSDPAEGERRMVLRLEILPNAVADLHRLGWLVGGRRLDDAVVAAIAELVERGIALGLRPS